MDEHFEAALDAWAEIDALEASIANRHTAVHHDSVRKTFRINIDDVTLATAEHIRMQRTFRVFLNEARAVLESLVYECVTALVPLPMDAVTGEEIEHKNLGMYNGSTRKLLKDPRFSTLHAHFESVGGDPNKSIKGCVEYERLNDFRATSFHRRILYPRRGMTWLELGDNPRPSVYFLLPEDAKAVVPSFKEIHGLSTFLVKTVYWLPRVVDKAYGLTVDAMRRYPTVS